MADLVNQISQVPGQPASVRVGTVASIDPFVVSAQGAVFNNVGWLGSYLPHVGDPVILLGQSSQAGTDPTSWVALGRVSSTPASGVQMTKLQRNAAQSIPDSTFTSISWDGVIFDNMGAFPSGSTTLLTAPYDGWYELTGRPTFVTNAVGVRQGVWLYNGSTTESFVNMNATAGVGSRLSMLPHFINASAGDTFGMQVFQSSGGALNTESLSGTLPQLTLRYLGTSVS